MTKCQGLTLVDLLFVLAIVSLCLIFASHSFTVIKQNQTIATTNQLIGATQFARSHAIQSGESIFFCLSNDFQSCSSGWSNRGLIYRNMDQNKKLSNGDEVIRFIDFGNDSLIKWRAFQNKSYLEMTPLGMTYYQNGTYTICNKNRELRFAKALIMNSAGRPYLAKDKNKDGIVEYSNGNEASCD